MRGSFIGLVAVIIIALTLTYTYRPDLIESWMNWLFFTW